MFLERYYENELRPNIALFTVIENSDTNIGAGDKWREWDSSNPSSEPLEEEAIKCFESWRKNSGWYRNIDIYCICPSRKFISEKTKKQLKRLKVSYIEQYFPETERFECGYLNVPLVGAWFEKEIGCNYGHTIHIDLDMNILKQLPKGLIRPRWPTVGTLLGGKKPWCYVDKIFGYELKRNLESCFIISDPSMDFYETWWNCTQRILGNIKAIPEKYYAEIEEYALDLMYIESPMRYKLIKNQYQVGHRYPFSKKSNSKNILFHHNHLYESFENFEKYIKSRLE